MILAGSQRRESPPTGELYEALSRVFRAAAPAPRSARSYRPATTDSRYFRARGIVAYASPRSK